MGNGTQMKPAGSSSATHGPGISRIGKGAANSHQCSACQVTPAAQRPHSPFRTDGRRGRVHAASLFGGNGFQAPLLHTSSASDGCSNFGFSTGQSGLSSRIKKQDEEAPHWRLTKPPSHLILKNS